MNNRMSARTSLITQHILSAASCCSVTSDRQDTECGFVPLLHSWLATPRKNHVVPAGILLFEEGYLDWVWRLVGWPSATAPRER